MVGGTDGSGTRAVVDLLARLGVNMVIDDAGTYDVHAEEIGGWPPLVTPMLSRFHYLDYDPSEFASEPLIKTASQQVTTLLKSLSTKAQRQVNHTPKDYGQFSKHLGQAKPGVTTAQYGSASKSSFGFKAPISMAVLPLFYTTLGKRMSTHCLVLMLYVSQVCSCCQRWS